ncbi:MAG TPA: ABC transporter permease [Pyrinomonadaceae bacterium]|nr:ABC transporter permease [Pyrinomonadaceae bacterium]
MGAFLQDVRYGIRMLLKKPGFTVVAVLALALGIGANSAIFSVVNAVLLSSLPYKDPERLVILWETNPQLLSDYLKTHNEASPANFYDWQAQSHVFENLAAFRWRDFNLTGGDAPEQVRGNFVTTNMFTTLGVQPILGRDFLAEESQAGKENVVILSHGLWQRRFGAARDIIGRDIGVNGRPYTVVGVMPQGFEFPRAAAEMWSPLAPDDDFKTNRRSHFLYTRARLKPGTTIEQAQAEMDTVAARLQQQYPDSNNQRGVRVASLAQESVAQIKPALLILLAAVGFVLLIACANVANLMLARSAGRQKEIAIRTALGAGRLRIVCQLLTESVMLSLVGGVCGLLLALWGIDLLLASMPAQFALGIPGWNKIGLDFRVLGFTLGVSFLTGILFGLFPAWQASQYDLNESLKEGGKSSASSSRKRFRNALIVSEVMLALVLLVGAGLMLRSLSRLMDVKPGFDPENLTTLRVSLPQSQYSEDERVAAFYSELTRRVKNIPGVESAATIDMMPMGGSGGTTVFLVEGRPAPPQGQYPEANARTSSPGYFQTMRIPLLKGRDFSEHDTADSPRVVVVNETMARKYWPGEDPIGKRLLDPNNRTPPAEVIGVVGDVKHFGLDDKAEEYIYTSSIQTPGNSMFLVVRAATDPSGITPLMRKEVQGLDKELPVFDVKPMSQRIIESTASRRLVMFLLGIFAGVALILASVGIYGVMAYAVTQRTHEIGIRMALGARRADILKLVVRQGMLLVVLGVTLGLLVSFAVTRFMTGLLFGVTANDPATLAGVSLLLAAIAFIACLIPARRATKVDPMVALRYE